MVSGLNLPVLLTLAIQFNGNDLTDDDIRSALKDAREQLVYVNDALTEQDMDDMDE